MLFGRNQQQDANRQAPAAPGYGQQTPGENPGPSSPWAGMGGYPTQPSGTGYAGYTPGNTGNYGPAGAGQPSGGAWNYPQAGTGYAPNPQGYAQGTQPAGYGAAPAGYAGTAQGSYAGQGNYAPQGGYAGSAQGNYAGQTGYPGQAGYAGQAQAGYTGQGSYAPQGGYAQNAQGGYAGQTGYAGQPAAGGYTYPQAGAYPGYSQMGRVPQPGQGGPADYPGQIPLNGGGYVPPAVPVKKQPFVFQSWMLIALGGVLAVLLGLGLFLRVPALCWVFAVLAAGSIALFWIRPLISGNRRLCYTIIFAVLTVVALLSALGVLNPRDRQRTPSPEAGASGQTATASAASGGQGTNFSGAGTVAQEPTLAPATPTPAQDDTSTVDRLDSFFRYWAANRQDEMLMLCSPSWQSSADEPKTALFHLIANRTPLDYTIEKVSGTSEDSSRTVTVTATIDRNNGKDPVKYRLNVLMVREADEWYVDPQSLKTYEEAETPDPALAATDTPSPEPLVNAATVLYYNPDGGQKYHLDPNCKSTHAKFLPFKGHFTYGEINDDAYKNLSPCNVCAAPLRP